MTAVTIALILLTLFGHTALWVGVVNRVHSVGIPRPLVRLFSAPNPAMFFLIPAAAFASWWRSGLPAEDWLHQVLQHRAVWCYVLPCWTIGVLTALFWIVRRGMNRGGGLVRSIQTTVIDVAAQLGYKPVSGLQGRLASLVPGNQGLQIAVQQIELELPRLPPSLHGFSITLLSDLHYTGHIGIEFYKEVIGQANALNSDLVAVCGDFVDDVKYLGWIGDTLARLTSSLGVYFVLGNHDMFTGEAPRVRQALVEAGLIDLGSRWRSLQIGGAELILAGNELPWLKPAADMQSCPERSVDRRQLRVLLSHSPDQLSWARRRDFDFVMAGHTHGGQLRLPVIGPICCPSWHGVKYAAGIYRENPTVMYVSRGIAAETPLRLNCRPEVTKLILRCPVQ